MTATDGGCRVDLHAKVLSPAVVRRAKDRGIDVLVYAPHFTRLPSIRRAAHRYTDDDLLVVPGREVFAGSWRDRKHVLAVGLTDPVPDFVTFEGAVAAFERQSAATLIPHPEFLTVGATGEDVRAHRGTVHAVETYNPKHWGRHNRRARSIASTLDVPRYGSSYAHRETSVGEVWTTFECEIESEADLVAALRSGAPRRVERRDGARHRVRCLAEFAHLGWENSWKKFDRVVLPGMEPTHPGHAAYGGRFDDVRVY